MAARFYGVFNDLGMEAIQPRQIFARVSAWSIFPAGKESNGFERA